VPFHLLKECSDQRGAKERFLKTVRDALWILRDKKIRVWGLTFKPIRTTSARRGDRYVATCAEGAQVAATTRKEWNARARWKGSRAFA